MALMGAKLASVNPQAAALIDMPSAALNSEAMLKLMAGLQLPEDATPIATVYSGHQFGQYNPQLGDGRAMLIGAIDSNHHGRWELQIKGAGHTPYSRSGDGRAVLRSSIREYLCSEAMYGLGIPTTRALALAASNTPVYRETIESGATVLRMAPSFIRFGHFEYFFYTEQHGLLKQLADDVISQHYAEFLPLEDRQRYAAFFTEVVLRTAKMIAHWQAQVFCHGVMNTDNMSILGLTIDYGPFAFMDDFEPGFICNHSDYNGRYAFNRQVPIGLWNLNALAHALSPLINIDQLREALSQYEPTLLAHYRTLMQQKLGLTSDAEIDDQIIGDILKLLAKESRDYHAFFRKLSETPRAEQHHLADDFVDREAFNAWLTIYHQRLAADHDNDKSLMQLMQKHNPKYVLRNYLAQEAIQDAERGDYQKVNDLLRVLQAPFDEHRGFEHLSQVPPDWGKKLAISCSS